MPALAPPPSATHWPVCILGDGTPRIDRLVAAIAADPAFRVRVGGPVGSLAEAGDCVIVLVPEELAHRRRHELFGRPGSPRIVVVSDHPDVDAAVRWLRAGAADYFAPSPERLASLPARLRALLVSPPRDPHRLDTFRTRSFAVALEKASDGMVLSDEDGRIVALNRQMRRITGFSRTSATDLAGLLRALHPDPGELARAEERVREVVATGQPREAEAAARSRRGESLVLAVTMSPIRIGRRLWLLGSYRDLTACRRTEAALALREARSESLNQALAALAGNERLFRGNRDASLALLTETATRSLGTARAGVWFYDGGCTALRCADLFELPAGSHSAGLRIDAAAHPEFFIALEQREVIAAGDAAHDPATRGFAETYLRPLRIGASLHVPVRLGGRIIGVVCLEHVGPPRTWSAAEQSFASAIGSCVSLVLEANARREAEVGLHLANTRLEDRVRERTEELAAANARLREEIAVREQAQQARAASEQKYRLMVDTLPQTVFELDLEGNVAVLNREGLSAARLTPAAIAQGINLFSLVHPDDHARLRANWQRLLAGHPLAGEEYCFVRRDGTTFHGSSYAHLLVRDGRPVGVTGFLIDETRRKQAEEELRRAHADLEDRVIQRTAELAESNAELRRLLDKQAMDISLAHQVLLLVNAHQPRNHPLPGGGGLFTAGQSIPRSVEGGDHFFTRHLADAAGQRTLVSLKDQSGHEVGCILRSIITDLLHNALVGPAGAHRPLAEVVTRLNQEICRSHLFQDGDFFTALNLELDHASLRLAYVAAGHPPFLLVRGGEVRLLPELGAAGTNLPVGFIDNHRFTAATLQLQPGDKLILYTDGLLEVGAARQLPDLTAAELAARLHAILARTPDLHVVPLANRLFRDIAGCSCDEAVAAHALPDDVALVVLEVEQPGPVFEDRLHPTGLADLRDLRVGLTGRILAEWERHGVTSSPMRLQIVLEEALYNAWHHGNREDPAKAIVVRRRYGNDACLEIADEGPGFRPDQIGDPTAHENRTKPSGRGLFLIRRFADEARWSDGGRRLTLFFGDEKTFCPSSSRSPLPRLDLWNPSPTQPPTTPIHEHHRQS